MAHQFEIHIPDFVKGGEKAIRMDMAPDDVLSAAKRCDHAGSSGCLPDNADMDLLMRWLVEQEKKYPSS